MEENIEDLESTPADSKSISTTSSLLGDPSDLEVIELSLCCNKTIARHAAFNPMILCSGCQHIIKCFTSEKLYQQYLKFCKSRGRKVLAGFHSPYYVVIYRSFDLAAS